MTRDNRDARTDRLMRLHEHGELSLAEMEEQALAADQMAAAEQRGKEAGWDEAITSAESLGHFDNHCSPDTCPDEMRNVNPYRADQMEGDNDV